MAIRPSLNYGKIIRKYKARNYDTRSNVAPWAALEAERWNLRAGWGRPGCAGRCTVCQGLIAEITVQ